jgi:hypothetical protein
MLSKMLKVENVNIRKFQVLFLRNDDSQEVEVHEVKEVDFSTVQERLERGESVFITSKGSQKLGASKQKNRVARRMKTKLVTAFCFEHV